MTGEEVYFLSGKNEWQIGTVTGTTDTGRSYNVLTDEGTSLRRNRSHLKPRCHYIPVIEMFLSKRNKSYTVLQVQKLCGLLNFLCKCVIPGRVFTMRLYAMTAGKTKTLRTYHHIRITQENRLDLQMWKRFLEHPQIFCRPFLDLTDEVEAVDIDIFSDATGSWDRGFGAYCGKDWCFGTWREGFPDNRKTLPSIEYLNM